MTKGSSTWRRAGRKRGAGNAGGGEEGGLKRAPRDGLPTWRREPWDYGAGGGGGRAARLACSGLRLATRSAAGGRCPVGPHPSALRPQPPAPARAPTFWNTSAMSSSSPSSMSAALISAGSSSMLHASCIAKMLGLSASVRCTAWRAGGPAGAAGRAGGGMPSGRGMARVGRRGKGGRGAAAKRACPAPPARPLKAPLPPGSPRQPPFFRRPSPSHLPRVAAARVPVALFSVLLRHAS
jgi:hypothetical protein